ncbi:MAG: hypothetical protein KY462_12550 [Actinobacteria bacterium]|nr:hypothetical protein [Actinomycetota bacterium]
MRARWEDAERFLEATAELDLRAEGQVRPSLVAFDGEQLLFVAWPRPFDEGRYHAPLVELLALAAPLGADRLAAALPGRAWSFADPIPPVVDGVGDLRQRVLAIESVDAHRHPARRESIVRPFDLLDGEVRWHEPLRPGPSESWIGRALETAATTLRRRMRGSQHHVAVDQATRCLDLGHELAFSQPVAERLLLQAVARRQR